MIKLRDYPMDLLYEHKLVKTNKVELIDPKEVKKDDNKKIPIVSNSMFKTMFFNESRIKYSSKLISYFVNESFEELCSNLKLVKDELDKNVYSDKEQRVDYVGKFNDTYLNIEVNNCSDEEVMKRNILYAFRLMNKENKVGVSDKEATKLQTIQININNFSFVGVDKIVDVYTLRNEEDIALSNSPIIIQIYLPNLKEKYIIKGENSLSKFERLLLIYAESNIDTCKRLTLGDEIMEEFIEDAKDASRDEEMLCAYDKEWETRLWGKEEGLDEGYDKARHEIVKKMLEDDVPIETISKYTKLSEEEILEIKNS